MEKRLKDMNNRGTTAVVYCRIKKRGAARITALKWILNL